MLHRNYQIEGIVQGVGFRPFIYQIAKKHNLKGFVLNNSAGVEISIEGTKEHIKAFESDLKLKLPPLARIDFLNKKIKPLKIFKTLRL